MATKSLTTEANFGAARYIVAKLERSRQGEVKNVPDILDRSVSLNQLSAQIMFVSLAWHTWCLHYDGHRYMQKGGDEQDIYK